LKKIARNISKFCHKYFKICQKCQNLQNFAKLKNLPKFAIIHLICQNFSPAYFQRDRFTPLLQNCIYTFIFYRLQFAYSVNPGMSVFGQIGTNKTSVTFKNNNLKKTTLKVIFILFGANPTQFYPSDIPELATVLCLGCQIRQLF